MLPHLHVVFDEWGCIRIEKWCFPDSISYVPHVRDVSYCLHIISQYYCNCGCGVLVKGMPLKQQLNLEGVHVPHTVLGVIYDLHIKQDFRSNSQNHLLVFVGEDKGQPQKTSMIDMSLNTHVDERVSYLYILDASTLHIIYMSYLT